MPGGQHGGVWGDGEAGGHGMVWGQQRGKTHPVGRKAPNAWGLHDMHGNVWEWCSDWYYGDYPSGEVTDPTGASSGSNRVRRGGCWDDYAPVCRSADRYASDPSSTSNGLGFRLSWSSS